MVSVTVGLLRPGSEQLASSSATHCQCASDSDRDSRAVTLTDAAAGGDSDRHGRTTVSGSESFAHDSAPMAQPQAEPEPGGTEACQ
jgi:hypothetical protein